MSFGQLQIVFCPRRLMTGGDTSVNPFFLVYDLSALRDLLKISA